MKHNGQLADLFSATKWSDILETKFKRFTDCDCKHIVITVYLTNKFMPILNELSENDKIIIETNLTLVRYCAKLLHCIHEYKTTIFQCVHL